MQSAKLKLSNQLSGLLLDSFTENFHFEIGLSFHLLRHKFLTFFFLENGKCALAHLSGVERWTKISRKAITYPLLNF